MDYAAFAELLDYPATGTPPAAATASPVVHGLLEDYGNAARALGPGGLEESYAQLFDLQSECTLNLSHHLFADEWKRSAMLIELKSMFARRGMDCGTELPDHLCWLLRLMATAPGDAELAELRASLLIPALRALQERVRADTGPYPALLQALFLELSGEAVA